jgi:hypothetical protein
VEAPAKAAAMEASTPTAMATSRERRLGHANQDNRCDQDTKNSQQVGFFHLNVSPAPAFSFRLLISRF